MSNKVSIIGAGNVGSIVAYSLAMQGLAHEIILVDRDKDRAKGKALDMSHAASAVRSHSIVRAAESYEDVRDSKVVVITAGFPRKPGMTREDLLLKNAEIMRDVVNQVKEVAPDSILVVVSNPLDAMTYTALKVSGFPRERVVGMAGILDSARMAYFIYEKLGYGAGQIRASVIGGHGDFMVPLPRYSTVAGVPLSDLLTQKEIEEVVERTKHAGAEIVGYLKTGSAYFAPGKSTAIMVEAILKNSKQIFPCAVLLKGEYGVNDVVNGVPVMLGKDGAEKVIEVTLNPCEREQFRKSTQAVKEMIDILDREFFKEKQ
ncbi:MAG: malate dehydrogenase [Nautiliaceae bacterium]